MYHDGHKGDKLAKEVVHSGDALQKIKQCSECSSCAVTCARGINIQAQIKAMHQMFS